MGDLEKLMAAREEIDRALVERHSREQAVLFTDIVGSTEFFENKGDIEGLALVKRHNELLFPIVERHRGRVVKTVGDAIMAVFAEAAEVVGCMIEMQEVLAQANEEEGAAEIHVRMGAHCGRVMVDHDDVFGDTVNTAARVAHEAQGDEILVSCTLLQQLPEQQRPTAIPREPLVLKGKAEPLPVVAIAWGGGLANSGLQRLSKSDEEIFLLEIGVGPGGLRVAALDGAADKGTVKVYAELPLTMEKLDQLAHSFAPFVRSDDNTSYAEQIVKCGQQLFSMSLSDRARRRLRETNLAYLRLHVDDSLVHLPWELLNDGEEFFGLRFAMGRMVAARAEDSPYDGHHEATLSRKVLVVSNPSGDLPGAAAEGNALVNLFEHRFRGEVRHLEGPIGSETFFKAVKGCRLLHFAGHARRHTDTSAGGLELQDGLVTPEQLATAIGHTMPAFVFANSCHSSTDQGWTEEARGVFNLASALLTHGTQHYLAPMWEVPDEDGLAFALRFYEQMLSGMPYGEACRLARRTLRHAASSGGYVLYGDPRGQFVPDSKGRAVRLTRGTPSSPGIPKVSPATLPENAATDTAMPPEEPKTAQETRSSISVLFYAASLTLVVAAIVAAYFFFSTPTPPTPTAAKEAPNTAVTPTGDLHQGPLRLSVLAFKNLTGETELDYLSEGFAENLVTEFGQNKSIKLIERGQIDLDIGEIEFSQSKYVDPKTRAILGKISGAEVVVIGGFQQAAGTLRVGARYINVETGEVLHAVKVEDKQDRVFELQDALAVEIKQSAALIFTKMRP